MARARMHGSPHPSVKVKATTVSRRVNAQECCGERRRRDWGLFCYNTFSPRTDSWALNSAVECHPHTVEVTGSNPVAPTIHPSVPPVSCQCFKVMQLLEVRGGAGHRQGVFDSCRVSTFSAPRRREDIDDFSPFHQLHCSFLLVVSGWCNRLDTVKYPLVGFSTPCFFATSSGLGGHFVNSSSVVRTIETGL